MAKTDTLSGLEAKARAIAEKTGYELVDVCIEKEPTGRYLRFYIDKAEGVTLDDCEAFHKKVRPWAETVDYDFMEVCSPGLDRPVRTERDIRKAMGQKVSVHLYRPQDGGKLFEGLLSRMDDEAVAITVGGTERTFPRKAVSLVRMVPDLSALEDDTEGIVIESDTLPDE